MKLRTKLLLFTVPVGVIVLLLFEVLSYRYTSKEISRRIIQDNKTESHHFQSQVRLLLTLVESQFALLTEFRPFEQYLKYSFYELTDESEMAQKDIQQMFSRLKDQTDGFKSLTFFDSKGTVVAQSGSIESVETLEKDSESDQVWKRDFRLSAPLGTKQDGRGEWLRFSKTLKIGDEPSGRLVLELYLNGLFSALRADTY